MTEKWLCRKTLVVLLCYICVTPVFSITYYVDSISGNDGNFGTSELDAWRSISKVSSTTFSAGDSILLKCGSTWNNQQLWPKGSGSLGSPIVIDKYGTGDLPVLNGNGTVQDVVYLYNQQWWEISNLEITNYREGDNHTDPANLKRGVYVQAENIGAVHHIHLLNLVIHSVNGVYDSSGNFGKNNGGIHYEVTGTSTQTWFDDFLIDGCYIHDIDRTGISNNSSWSTRTDVTNTSWVPSLNVVIRNTIVERASHNAVIPRVSDGALVEYCTFINNGIKGNGNAIFPFNTDNTTIQYCEAYGTYYNEGDHDAAGFDSDGKNKNLTIQYNYSHDNGLGGIVMAVGDGDPPFNTGCVIRYNILENNQRQAFRLSGVPSDVEIYNNIIYIGPELSSVNIIYHKNWGGWPDNITYANNIFYNLGSNSYYDFGSSTNIFFDHNVFYGNHPSSEPVDSFKLTSDPMFLSPGSGGIGLDTVTGYKLKEGSPCVDSGLAIADNGGQDYWGNSVPFNVTTDRGANEYGTDDDVFLNSISSEPTNISPIPVTVAFIQSKTGFDESDIIVTNAAVGNFTGSGKDYSFDLTPLAVGAVTAQVPENVTDQGNTESNLLSRVYHEPIPSPWQNKDLDDSGPTGNAGYSSSSGLFFATGGGADLSDPVNGSQFVYRPLNGDGEIKARVLSIENTHADAKAAVMIRENLTNSSLYAMSMVTASNGAGYQYIDTLGALTPIQLFVDGFTNCFGNWQNSGAYCSSSFYPGGDPQSAKLDAGDYIQKDLSTVGYDNQISVQYARKTDSGVQFYAEWYDGSTWQILEDISGSSGWTLKDFDLPAGANANPDFAIRFRVDSGDYAFVDMVEITTTHPIPSGDSFVSSGLSAQYWIRVVRSGNTFSFHDSPDGLTWNHSGSVSIPMASNTYIGMAVTAHQVDKLCTAGFDNVFYGLPADISGNGVVDIDDLFLLSSYWLQGSSIADISPVPVDGTVDLQDFSVIAEYWLDSY